MPNCSKSNLLPEAVAAAALLLTALLAALVVPTVGCSKIRIAAPSADSEAAATLREQLATASVGASAVGDSAAASGTGWATLKGRFVFAGSPAEAKLLVVDKDTEVCTKGGMKLVDRSLTVDPSTKALADVVVFARKTSRVKEATPPTDPLVFDQKQCEFLMPVFAARVGRPIEVKNSDPIGHNTNIGGTPFNQLIPAGQSTIYTPASETGMPTTVTCNIHPWMKAYAVFRKDGYVAVSGGDGTFTIADLPAGETVEFQAWHARSTGANGALGLDMPAVKWTARGRFQVKLEPDEVRDLGTIEVPSSAIGG